MTHARPLPDTEEDRGNRQRTPGTAIRTTPQLLRHLEVRLELLKARGLPVPDLPLADAYARFLVGRALNLSPAPDEESGYDAADASGVRYRIAGRRASGGTEGKDVLVPGLPDRRFDRVVIVRFGGGYGVVAARMASVEDFLERADYLEQSNEWQLSYDDPLWQEARVDDLTIVLRAVAADLGEDGEMPAIEPFSTPTAYPRRRREAELTPPQA